MALDYWYKRIGIAVKEYQLDIDSLPYRSLTEFRHYSKVDQDNILSWFRRDFPKLYSLLMELQIFDEQFPHEVMK